jgi:hypothetical protein
MLNGVLTARVGGNVAYRVTSQIEIERGVQTQDRAERGAREGSRARVTKENERGGEGFVLPLLATPPTYWSRRKDARKNKGPLIIGGKILFLPMENKTTVVYTKYLH